MKISPITNSPRFTNNNRDLLSKFHENTKNSADMTDTVVVPRTIFKGYLAIMTGTTFVTLGSAIPKHPRLSGCLKVGGLLTSLYGTWAFVRPYIVKDAKGVDKTK